MDLLRNQYNEQPNFDFNPYSNPYKKKPNKMANLSLLFGVLSLLSVISIYFIYFALPLGSLSILFAHLSKGDGYRLPESPWALLSPLCSPFCWLW